MGRDAGLADLVVLHEDGDGARRTIEQLSRAGVDGGAIVLLGPVEAVTEVRVGDRQTDGGSSRVLLSRLVRGWLLGAVPGVVFGLALLLAVGGEQPLGVLLAGSAGGLLLGAGIGALVALLSTPTMAASWERTFSPLLPGGVAVGIHVTSRRAQRRAHRALRRLPSGVVEEVDDLGDLPPRQPGPGEP